MNKNIIKALLIAPLIWLAYLWYFDFRPIMDSTYLLPIGFAMPPIMACGALIAYQSRAWMIFSGYVLLCGSLVIQNLLF
ncbi:hypothetical protein [Vibrio sp. CK2-1]|uniref:hypothetical protein n=1 Tax=Vibrio sp. CK2-1 TaxID=2912249 RepID=UPI001F160AE8|nr:hypothetical protein [Vibrio sp. CK2-1]MCF7353401.1 hypothetical protein [Vibrio sp. CK2-1]